MTTASFILSILALSVSAITMWLTLLRRGTVRMTRPNQIYFGADGAKGLMDGPAKVFARATLYSTSKRGRVVEGLWANLSRNVSMQAFPIWVHGDDKLVRGAGLHVPETGLAMSHHFLPPKGESYIFEAGTHRLQILARLTSSKKPILLLDEELELSSEQAATLKSGKAGVYFDYGMTSEKYLPSLHAPVQEWLESLAR
ncbi:hypothetical protein WJS89_06080 [Sphingomicrobium sp. XHP0235]|uniref:hypothetical protein n=1 Tax=Sphingomicrobium aquimarinum TaxID=3133971 RepID=UPI0031FE5805